MSEKTVAEVPAATFAEQIGLMFPTNFQMPISEKEKKETGKKVTRLNAAELQALFRRLDINGDGELSYNEFRNILVKLKIREAGIEDVLGAIFNEADQSGDQGGALNMSEFLNAYNILYNRISGNTNSQAANASQGVNFVKATRYGFIGQDSKGDRQFVFEVYSGTFDNINKKFVFEMPNNPDDAVIHERIEFSDLPYQEHALQGYTMETINKLILLEGERNQTTGARVFWWVDASSKTVYSHEIQQFMTSFGIPESSRGSFTALEDNNRVTCSSGEVICDAMKHDTKSYLGQASVLSMFVSLMHVDKLPMVQRDPYWMKRFPRIVPYLSSRLSIFYDFSNVRCSEKKKLNHRANDEAHALLDDFSGTGVRIESPASDILPAHGTEVPLSAPIPADYKPFLLNNASLKLRRANLKKAIFSMHVQNQGYGPWALVTFRTMDSDLKDKPTGDKDDGKKWSVDQHSRAGALGRLLAGVWKKLFEVTANEGVASIGAEIADSPFALAVMMTSLVHNLSMDTIQTLDAWTDRITKEIEDCAVTKHGNHIELFAQLQASMLHYVAPFNDAITPIIAELEMKKGENEMQAKAVKRRSASEAEATYDTFVGGPADVTALRKSVSKEQRRQSIAFTGTIPSQAPENHDPLASSVYAAASRLVSSDPLGVLADDYAKMDASEKVTLLESFAIHNSLEYWPNLLRGSQRLELKGTAYWTERLQKFELLELRMNERYQRSLDEKRNFWGFTLGLVTIATFPFAVMTGYFGMNFENMAEPNQILTNEFWPAFPGQYMIWFFTLVIYGVMLFLALHYRVIHAAL